MIHVTQKTTNYQNSLSTHRQHFFAWKYCEIRREITTCCYFVDHIMEFWGQLSEVWNSKASQGNPDFSAVS